MSQKTCVAVRRLGDRLRDFQSLISHARKIDEGTDAIVWSLKERPVNPALYRLSSDLAANLKNLRAIAGSSDDFRIRKFTVAPFGSKAAIAYIEGISDQEMINSHVLGALAVPPVAGLINSSAGGEAVSYIKETLLTSVGVEQETDMALAVRKLMGGAAVLLVDGSPSFLLIASEKPEKRPISQPETEVVVRGPREGFVEQLQVNISLVRRRLKEPNLIIRKLTLGEKSNTEFAVIYFRGVVNPRLACEVMRRLRKLKLDAVLDAGTIQGLIEDHPYSLFPTIITTERPDTFAASIVAGKVGIIIDGFPFSLLAPAVLSDFFQTSDDYDEKWMVATLIRFTRYMTSLVAMLMPAIYIAVTTFHPGLIPTPLTMNIVESRVGVPFPALVEALIMEILLEILQEAGVRLPKTIGPAVSIVGGLVVGEAAVQAGLVSTSIVIITAVTAIASFNIANYRLNLIVRFFRMPLMAIGACFGMVGVMVGLLAILIHVSLLESFGEPFLGPLVPKNTAYLRDLKDTLIVAPPQKRERRPFYLEAEDR